MKCLVCKSEIDDMSPCLTSLRGSICMGCEGAEVDIYHVTPVNATGRGYCDQDISVVAEMIKECDFGEGYTVRKEIMLATRFFNLPEFVGF